jgi:serine/threonine-protein kinase
VSKPVGEPDELGDADLEEVVEEPASESKTPVKGPPPGTNERQLAPLAEGAQRAEGEAKLVGGRRFGRFELMLEMGSGGMATLYLARIRGPQNFEKLIAIKKIHDHLSSEQEFVEMFLDEARISAMIHHPNVVQIFDLGSIDGAYFIAMEYVHGQDLAQLLRAVLRTQNKTYSWVHAARMVADAANGLHAAHELENQDGRPMGLVHRDISPQNILVGYDGHVKVVDFGIAFAAEKISQTGVGTLKGKASYMSPEQSRGEKVDRRSDIFALGILLFEGSCMKRLFREETEAGTLLRVGAADVPRPRSVRPDLPAELEKIILRCLARNPDERYDTAADLALALEQLLVSRGEVLGPAQISQLMSELFHDRKRIRDGQIREVLQRPGNEVQPAIGMSATTVTQLGSLTDAETGPHRRWLTPLLIGISAVAALSLGGLLLYWKLSTPAPRTPVATAPREPMTAPPRPDAGVLVVKPDAAPAPPAREKVWLDIKVLPEAAKVTILFRGKEYPQSALETLAETRDEEEVVEIRAPGYQTEKIYLTVNAKAKLKHEIRLKPEGRTPRPRPMGPDDDLMPLPR